MKRTKKRLKIKWNNIALLVILLLCAYIVIHDLFMITIYSFVTNNLIGWTWYGLITFMISAGATKEISEYFCEEINK